MKQEEISMQKKGNKYGVHRVIEPQGLMTQGYHCFFIIHDKDTFLRSLNPD